uniref:Uncharacterized protein n=2 Tax=Anguilla anguilla TaxID=7936 RepID=A0A0E9SW70_ANGAN
MGNCHSTGLRPSMVINMVDQNGMFLLQQQGDTAFSIKSTEQSIWWVYKICGHGHLNRRVLTMLPSLFPTIVL